MRGAEEKHAAAEEWCEDLLLQQEKAIDRWERDLERLATIPGRPEFAQFVQARDPATINIQNTTLQDFVDVQEVHEAGARAKDSIISFAQRVADLRSSLTATGKASEELLSAVDQVQASSLATSSMNNADEPIKLMEEIDIIVNKMRSDLEHVSSLPANGHGPPRASKMALLHTRNYLPNLSEFCGEINDLVRRTIDTRNTAAETSMTHMQSLASVEGRLSKIFHGIKALEVSVEDQHAFNLLNVLSRLPYVYGSLLIEAVRRREWSVKMKKDSATLAEEMATFQEEEARRRKKWLLSVDDVVNPEFITTKPQGVELSLQTDEQNWPSVPRQELHDYLSLLERLDLPAEVVQELTTALQDLDRPTKKQVRLARNAFKNGSVHDAAFGTTSLMMRGGDEQKVLRDVNAKLEEELRGQKSRVRKLEDLLHRQASMQRAVSGGESAGASTFSPMMELMSNQGLGTPPLPGAAFSPRASEDMVRHASIGTVGGGGSRRASTTLATQTEEKKLARRVVALEAELHKVKEQSATLEKEKSALEEEKSAFEQEKTQKAEDEGTKQAQFDEAVSTKKDIMENMEAQQREFADERRVLEEELRLARGRVEEIEDEIERVLGSRDHVDTRTKELELELERVRGQADQRLEEVRVEMEKEMEQVRSQAEQEVEGVKSHAEQQIEQIKGRAEQDASAREEEIEDLKRQLAERSQQDDIWEMKLHDAQRNAQNLLIEKEELEQTHAGATDKLVAAHRHLSPQSQHPEKFTDLVSALEMLAGQQSAHAKSLSGAHDLLVSEKQSLHSQNEAQSDELKAASSKYAVLEAEVIRLRDEMASEKAHASSLSSCLDDERAQLRDLRSKFATGETGVHVLRARVEEEEGKVVELTEKLAEVDSHKRQVEDELARTQTKLAQVQSEVISSNERLNLRASKAKEVSQRLYAQNTRFLRLLDQLGFIVSHKDDGSMVIERASKVNNVASTMLDSTSASRNFSSPPPMSSRKTSRLNTNEHIDPATVSFLHWSDSPDAATEETAYAYFIQQTSLFDPQVFSEALSKRLRDFEYTARKWSKEAKSFSTLSARLRHESNQKIAVRDFKEGDLALFLPTRGELGNKGAWAAFNIGAPHHFLREREGMGLSRREWLVARISRVEERVVDLKNGTGARVKGSGDSLRSIGSTSVDAASLDERRERDDDNPFELSDGLTWYLVHASEDKAGAPSTPGLGKVTVASSSVDARGSIRLGKKRDGSAGGAGEAVKTLGNVRSLDSRRSSEASRKSGVVVGFLGGAAAGGSAEAKRVPSDQSVKGLGISSSTSPGAVAGGTVGTVAAADNNDQVRTDLLFGP